MSGALHLISGGARASGLTRDNPYESLHSAHLIRQPKQPREPSPSIFAAPRSVSSDEDFDGQQTPDGKVSDDSGFGKSEEKGRPGGRRVLRTGTGSISTLGEDDKRRDLSVEPSNIRASTFTSSGKGPEGRNGSQSNQKRNGVDIDDDFPFDYVQKKPRHSYSNGNLSKHKGIGASVTKLGKPSKMTSKGSEKAGIRIPNTDAMLAIGRITLPIGISKYVRLTPSS